MRFQFEYAGTGLVNTRILVYEDMLDVPQPQFKTVILPPDPIPVMNARPENYAIDEQPVSVRYTTDGRIRVIAGVPQGTGAAWVIERVVAVQGDF